MAVFTPPKLSARFQMSYKEDEREFYEEIENNIALISDNLDLLRRAV